MPMLGPIANLRQTVRRAGRSISFQRSPHPERPTQTSHTYPSASSKPPNHSHSRSRLTASRSFPNLSCFVERKGPVHDQRPVSTPLPTPPSPPPVAPSPPPVASSPPSADPQDPFSSNDQTLPNLSFTAPHSTSSATSPDPLTSSTVTSASSTSAPTISLHSHKPKDNDNPLPPPTRPFLRRLSSSQRLSRLSLGNRSLSRSSRNNSFVESNSRAWSSTGPASLSPRAATDDFLWSRLRGARAERARSMRRKRLSSYSCSDFEVAEEDALVEIGERLPDRENSVVMEDVFGRRRGDIPVPDDLLDTSRPNILACDTVDRMDDQDTTLREHDMQGYLRGLATGRQGGSDAEIAEEGQEELAIRNIVRALDSSKGRLRKSANMSRAFRAVVKSGGEGLIRKSDIIRATLESNESKDPSMIILLDPSSCDPSLPQMEGVSTTSEESCSVETVSSSNAVSSTAVGFSTSMTAKQCAATLETLLREMACKVSRCPDTEHGLREVLRLRVMRVPPGGRKMDRKIKIMITIREEDHIRTSVSFKRIAGLYSSRDSHIPLCTDIRDRFQREWPAIVEALYIRLPNVPKGQPVL